jgi:hypothetical protein
VEKDVDKVLKILESHEVYCYTPSVAAKWIFAVCGIVTLYGVGPANPWSV